MLEHCQAHNCSSRSTSGLLASKKLHCALRSPLFVAAVTSRATPDRQRLQLHQAQSLQLAPQHSLVSSNLSNRPATNGVHGSNKRLKVAVDVDEGAVVWLAPIHLAKGCERSISVSAVLGRFLHSLNKYCSDTHGLNFDICDYSDYNFHKVRIGPYSITSCRIMLAAK